MLKTNEGYTVLRAFKASVGDSDDDTTLDLGETLVGKGPREAVGLSGSLYVVPALVASRPDWYLGRGFNPQAPEVKLPEAVKELVRANPGLTLDDLWTLFQECCPCAKVPSYHVFSSALANHQRVEKRIDGETVRGTAKERGHLRGMTYWPSV